MWESHVSLCAIASGTALVLLVEKADFTADMQWAQPCSSFSSSEKRSV